MNTVQHIFNMIIKIMNLELFKSNFTGEEKSFLKKLKASGLFESLKIEKTKDGKFVLTWESSVEETIGCWIDDKGIYFNTFGLYNRRKDCMEIPISACFSQEPDKKEILDIEVDKIKTLFMTYSIDAETYFK